MERALQQIAKSKVDTTEDTIYFNAVVNNPNATVPSNWKYATFDQTRTDNIVDKASDYYLAVARFELPGHYIPLHIFPIQFGQSDPNLSVYSVTLEYNGVASQQYLNFVTSDESATVPTTADPEQIVGPYYFVYTYQHLLKLLNTAFSDALSNLAGAPGGAAPPVMSYDASTKLFTLEAMVEYYDIDEAAIPIYIYMNTKLYILFQGFFVNTLNSDVTGGAPDGKDVQFQIENFSTATYDDLFYYITQNYISISNWNPFKRIVFISSGMPIQSEYIPTSDDASEKVLVDFRPDESSQEDIRSVYQYTPQFYRLIGLTSNLPLRRVAFRIYWEDKDNNFYLLKIPFLQQMSVKFALIRKNLARQ